MTLKGGWRHRRQNQISSFLKTCRAAALEKSFLCITSDKMCASSRLMCHGSVCQQSNIHVFVPGRPKIVLQKIRFDESCWGALLMNRIFVLMLDASSRLESAQEKKNAHQWKASHVWSHLAGMNNLLPFQSFSVKRFSFLIFPL